MLPCITVCSLLYVKMKNLPCPVWCHLCYLPKCATGHRTWLPLPAYLIMPDSSYRCSCLFCLHSAGREAGKMWHAIVATPGWTRAGMTGEEARQLNWGARQANEQKDGWVEGWMVRLVGRWIHITYLTKGGNHLQLLLFSWCTWNKMK